MAGDDAGRRTQSQRRLESERSLLAAAAEAVAARGIERTSLAQVGERAGKSRGLANHHFGSKETLVERLAARCQDQLEAATIAGLERAQRSGPLTAVEAVRTMVDTYLEHFEHPSDEERALLVLWGATFPTHASVGALLEADRRAYDGLASMLEEGQRAGSVSDELDPRATAVVLLGMMRGVAAQQLTESAVIDVRAVRAACHHWITAALAP